MLQHLGKVMGAENRIDDLGQEGKHSLGKMLQGPFRDTIRFGALQILRPLMAS